MGAGLYSAGNLQWSASGRSAVPIYVVFTAASCQNQGGDTKGEDHSASRPVPDEVLSLHFSSFFCFTLYPFATHILFDGGML